MNWSEEPWVKLYINRTAAEMALCWEAQLLIPALLKVADRCGVIYVDGGPKRLRLLSGLLNRIPVEFLQKAVADLLDDGFLVERDVGYVIPNYLAAQSATASGAQRLRTFKDRKKDREKARAAALGIEFPEETKRFPPPPEAPKTAPTDGGSKETKRFQTETKRSESETNHFQKETIRSAQSMYRDQANAISAPPLLTPVPDAPRFFDPPPPPSPKRFTSGSKPVVSVKNRKRPEPPKGGEEEGRKSFLSGSWETLEGEISPGFFLGWWGALRGAPERAPAKFMDFWADVEAAGCSNRKILWAAFTYRTQVEGAVDAPNRPLAVFIRETVWPQRIQELPPPAPQPQCSVPGCGVMGTKSTAMYWDKRLCHPHGQLECERHERLAPTEEPALTSEVRH